MLQSGAAYLRAILSSSRCNRCNVDGDNKQPVYTDDDGDDNQPVCTDYGGWSWRIASYGLSGHDVRTGCGSFGWSGRRTGVNDPEKQEIPQHWSASGICSDLLHSKILAKIYSINEMHIAKIDK